MTLSFIGLVLGAIALGLAAIPSVAFDRAPPNPFAPKEDGQKLEPPVEREGGVNLKFKNLTINVGGKLPKKEQPAGAPVAVTKDPIRWFTIAAMSLALMGLVVTAIGQLRERHTVLTISSMSFSVAAITWQYFVFGIVVGAAAGAFLIVLAILARAVTDS